MTETHFCPNCGEPVAAGDRFCRTCGQSLSRPPGEQVPAQATEEPARSSRRRTLAVAAGLFALALLAAAVVILVSGVLAGDGGDDAQERRVAAERPAFEQEMRRRDKFFQLERRYMAAMEDARGKIAAYRRDDRDFKEKSRRIEEEFADEFDACGRYAAIPCPEPDYPEPPRAPSFGAETERLRTVAAGLQELSADLTSVSPSPTLRVLHTQLVAAVDALQEEVEHNADVLDEAAQPAEGEAPGALDRGKLKTLREDTAMPAVRQMNQAAVRVIQKLGLPRSQYDVPGGRDVEPDDHSSDV